MERLSKEDQAKKKAFEKKLRKGGLQFAITVGTDWRDADPMGWKFNLTEEELRKEGTRD